ncbi:MAG: isoaspartyl peptidase/L-asparaginase family protein [Solirubrobacterales bacterium]
MGIVLVHGGVETPTSAKYMDGVRGAALCGYNALSKGVLDAAEQAVNSLEDNPVFSAGTGSVLNATGEAEMDAAIMDGESGRCAAVAAIRMVRNPVSVARRVMEKTGYVLLAGDGAVEFARDEWFPPYNPVTEEQYKAWVKGRKAQAAGNTSGFHTYLGLPMDTVGGLVCHRGRMAAASSTGGMFLKHPGRVGDTPVIGAGLYASKAGAAACTGHGERFIECTGAARAIWLLEQGASVEEAAKAVLERISAAGSVGGILVIDAKGRYTAMHNGRSMPVAVVVNGKPVDEFQAEKVTFHKKKGKK